MQGGAATCFALLFASWSFYFYMLKSYKRTPPRLPLRPRRVAVRDHRVDKLLVIVRNIIPRRGSSNCTVFGRPFGLGAVLAQAPFWVAHVASVPVSSVRSPLVLQGVRRVQALRALRVLRALRALQVLWALRAQQALRAR